MSKYHPLDVRHPSNRDLLSRNYLLDPPAPRTRTVAERPAKAGARPAAATPASSPARPRNASTRQVSAPWSGSSPAETQTRRSGSGFLGFLRSLLILGVIGAVVAQQTDLLEPLLFRLRVWALEMGFALPF